ncbi:uncharacterized protein G2W53_043698 [Senna tora]|uniref:RPM1 interacting protein 13 n=1 Tax=Senna tora TaxID=362788 RepID=A0A834SPC3_9FABA|nr:uncharacterized protein G2W53_043698 [Senna tora]
MDPMPVILDISSDEEGGMEGPENLDYDWIKELLGDSDKESDDSDEVVIIREVKSELKSKSSRPSAKDVDDDCVVLDGDPENCITSVNEAENESDELLIVGEKGQIACRDYPHPRHLCAIFPFSSTPHERYCNQCHCYVCDLPAPCLKWSTGISSTDHCHATDKAEMWKIQRKNFKLGKNFSLPASTNVTSPIMTHPQRNQVLPLGIIQVSENSTVQNRALRAGTKHMCTTLNPTQEIQASAPTIVRACSSLLDSTIQNEVSGTNALSVSSPSTNIAVPSGTVHGRRVELGSTLARNRFQPYLISNQLLGVCNNSIRRDRRHGAGGLGPQFQRSHLISKGVDNVGATVTVNHSDHGSSGHHNHVNPSQQYGRDHATTGLSNEINNGWNDVWLATNLSSYPHPSSAQPILNCVSGNTMAPKTPEFSQPPLTRSNNILHQSCILGNEAPSYVACAISSQQGNELQITSQYENGSENIIHCGNPSQDTSQQQPQEGNQCETTRKEDLSVLFASWTQTDSPSIEPVTDNSHVPSSASINQPPVVNDIENWLFDKDSGLGGDAAFPSFLDIPSPDISPVDTGMILF